MPALEKRITSLERIQGTVVLPRIVVKFVSPTRGLVGMRCGTFTMNRLEHETEVQFLVRARQELLHAGA
jgi:hypothetical protein